MTTAIIILWLCGLAVFVIGWGARGTYDEYARRERSKEGDWMKRALEGHAMARRKDRADG